MTDIQTQRQSAIETMRSPPPVDSKLAALDALDRLGINPSGWFPERLLTTITDARIAIITDRWGEARRQIDDARSAIETFIEVVKTGPVRDAGESREDAIARAHAELSQLLLVADWVAARESGDGAETRE